MEGTTFGTDAIARCNRCDAKGHLSRPAYGIRENDRAWRLQDMRTIDTCEHMDSHWVYDADQAKA